MKGPETSENTATPQKTTSPFGLQLEGPEKPTTDCNQNVFGPTFSW